MAGRISGVLDFAVARLPRKPAAYFFAFLVWAVTLWFLSAGNPAPKNGPDIPHIDKVAHFVYFFGGGALLAAGCGLRWPGTPAARLFWLVVLAGCVIGRLDEYHQGFTPGRSGNDAGDWLADTLGAAAGVLAVTRLMLPRMFAGKRLAGAPAEEKRPKSAKKSKFP